MPTLTEYNSQPRPSTLPGKRINLAFSLFYLILFVMLPLGFLLYSLHQIPLKEMRDILSSQRVLHAFQISFSLSLGASCLDLVLGFVIAWVLVKIPFPGRRIFDVLIDLPFAMPTAISGISLAALYAEDGWIGHLFSFFGIKVSYTPLGILIALVFVGLPFVVRALQPAIRALEPEMEEAAQSLGASKCLIFYRIIIPQLLPSIITGFTMSLARGLGEYGSVIFIAGNIPLATEILPLLVVIDLEQFDYRGASVLASVMLLASLSLLVFVGAIGKRIKQRFSP